MSDRPGVAPPRAAMALGLAGLLPPAAAILFECSVSGGHELAFYKSVVAMLALAYVALILSFLGGMWWSAACNRLDGTALTGWLAVSVLPSLWALASVFGGLIATPPAGSAVMLAIGLLAALIVDRQAVRSALVPAWWMRLRVPLSCGLAIEALAVAWLA